ncbi:NADH dehydrogenase 1 alpha subcomplex assembly factor 3 [Fusarium flagelliforme]|uniref:NADH dehydrogenase 1 alpha subcomplex assembly factor 3 n=1 Tax=Fusarium flagelliforme TaxID=2675880 RepID=UPI001E8CCFF2|nr:NADH dehydrogenase 1 alpha subcomplex assembly factor 3 [Fusarium flagelliforme]KAH7173494.1 NADH dehydrogenase 1 alpha subcomplex assembly factor 3 [Fusarium flagelliforme]
MASRSLIPSCSAQRAVRRALTQAPRPSPRSSIAFRTTASQVPSPLQAYLRDRRLFHAVPGRRKDQQPPAQPPPTDFSELDVLGNTPAPSTSVDVCMYDGFGLNSGITITGGNGVLLIDGEVFKWRPWEAKGSMNLVNKKGQFELPPTAFALFDLLYPRPDLLIIGVGPSIMPLAPDTRRVISELGMRIEILDTRNAAAQFNLLATERGVSNVAAALIPIGWQDGVGAK